MVRAAYPSDLSDTEWIILEPLIPPAKTGGRKRTVDMREVVNGIFYVLRSGGAWRMLPHKFSPWETVYGYFNQWRTDGIWEQMNDALREAVRLSDFQKELAFFLLKLYLCNEAIFFIFTSTWEGIYAEPPRVY